jgi:hypothetical protein
LASIAVPVPSYTMPIRLPLELVAAVAVISDAADPAVDVVVR